MCIVVFILSVHLGGTTDRESVTVSGSVCVVDKKNAAESQNLLAAEPPSARVAYKACFIRPFPATYRAGLSAMKFCDTLDEQRQLSPVEWGPFFLNYKLLKVHTRKMRTMYITAAL